MSVTVQIVMTFSVPFSLTDLGTKIIQFSKIHKFSEDFLLNLQFSFLPSPSLKSLKYFAVSKKRANFATMNEKKE